MKDMIFLLFALCSLTSCKYSDTVIFEEPQPVSEKAISSFGRNIQGTYINSENPSDELVIESNLIRKTHVLAFSCLRSELEIDSHENIDVNDNQELFKYLSNQGGMATIQKDSIFYRQSVIDTLFLVSNDQILKKFARNYFLNYRQNDNYWRVKKMEIVNDTLFIGEIIPSDTLLQFDFVKKNERIIEERIGIESRSDLGDADSDALGEKRQAVYKYILSPNKKDLRAMMKSNSFDDIVKYVRK